MTVAATNPYSTATGNGAATSFPFTFAARNVADVAVYVNGALQNSGFTVTLNSGSNGGTVVFAVAPANAAAIIIASAPPFTQQISFENAGSYNPLSVDGVADAATIRDIFLQGLLNRTALAPIGETMGPLPAMASRAGKFFGFDAGGNPTPLSGTGNDSALRTDIAASGGSALVGFLDNGTGATATTVQSFLRQINHLPTGNWYSPAAKVQRLNDRVLVGGAALNNATNVASQPDWLTTYELAQGRSFGALQSAQMGVLSSGGQGSNALVAGAQTSTLLADNYNAIGIWGVAVNNRGVSTASAYGGYFEGHRKGTGSGAAFAIEADIINFVSAFAVDPFTNTTPETVGFQLSSGGQYAPANLFSASAGLALRNNGADFLSGIVFGFNAIHMTAGVGEAIAFATGHKMQWYGAAGVGTSSIYSDGTTAANGIALHIGEGFAELLNSAGKQLVRSNNVTSAVNYVLITNSITGSAVSISAAGTDANVDLDLIPKGTGLIQIGNAGSIAANGTVATALTSVGPTGSHTTVQEWLQFKNPSGVVRYVPAF